MTSRNPGEYSTEIQNVSECAFQRAIILGKESKVNDETIRWIDIELPVAGKKARGKCLDLIGIDSDGHYVICELKFRRNHGDNGGPEEAAKQLCDYYECIKDNVETLKGLRHTNSNGEICWEKVAENDTRKFVVANKEYYASWCERKKTPLKNLCVEFYSVDVDSNEFDKQKNNNKSYTPEMPSNVKSWSKVN
jgi:RecB family endonuclease NucS